MTIQQVKAALGVSSLDFVQSENPLTAKAWINQDRVMVLMDKTTGEKIQKNPELQLWMSEKVRKAEDKVDPKTGESIVGEEYLCVGIHEIKDHLFSM